MKIRKKRSFTIFLSGSNAAVINQVSLKIDISKLQEMDEFVVFGIIIGSMK